MLKHVVLGLLLVSPWACAQLREGAPGTEAWIAVTHNGVQRANIECGEDVFDPSEIVVKANVPVALSVRGTSDTLQFINQGFSPKNEPIGKQPSAHMFTPSTHGKYEMSCQPASGAPGRIKKGVLIVLQ
jgi:heme/copper-type cytochrome/quinol oxidase subunit 2